MVRLYSGATKPRPGQQLDWSHPLARDLVARYLFNEGNGTVLSNLVGKFHAALNGMDPPTDWVGSGRGGALDFDGTDDYAFNSGISINGLGAASLCLWFRTATGQSSKYMLSLPQSSAGSNGFDLYLHNSTNVGAHLAAATVIGTATYADYRWHQLVATYDGATLRVYFDGQLLNSTAASGAITAAANELNIGRFGTFGAHAAIQVDDVRVYRRCLHESEVASLYADPYADQRGVHLWLRKEREHATLEIEAELDGAGNGWTDLTADARYPIQLSYGIEGGGPLDLVAGAGSMTFSLSNGRRRGNPVGYYSPGNANCRAGFQIGIPVRFRYVLEGATYFKFAGWLETVSPSAGQYRGLVSECLVLDWMSQAERYFPNVVTQVNKRADEIIAALVAAVPRQPIDTDLDVGDSTFPYALDNSESESQSVLTECQRLMQSEFGRLYIKGDTTAGGLLRFEKRTARLAPMVVATVDDQGGLAEISAPHRRDLLVNRVKATVHPRRVDSGATTVLFTNQGQPSIAAGATIRITGYYNDPANRASRVGGKDMVTPIAAAIATSSVANPSVITTSVPHGFSTGDSVVIYGHAGSTPSINGVHTITVTGASTFTIPVNVTVGGTGGAAVVDYRANTVADGSGTDLTSSLTVTATFGANSVEYVITNGSGSAGFLTRLQARGRGLYDYDPVDAWVSDSGSIADHGEAQLTIDMPYQAEPATAQAVAQYVSDVWSDPAINEVVVTIHGVTDANRALIIQREPGDAITVRETVLGLNQAFHINHVDVTFYSATEMWAEWLCVRAPIQNYWTLGTAGKSELGETTVVAPF